MKIWKSGAIWIAASLLLAGCGTALPSATPAPTAIAPLATALSTLTPLTPSETLPPPTPTLPTPSTPPTSTVLPAPLYFLAASEMPTNTLEQIWRMEPDGRTLTQITNEWVEITDYDVSPQDSSVAFISANTLIKTDALGQNRTVLVQGPALAQNDGDTRIIKEIRNVQWSADGAHLFYGLNGINQIGANGGERTVLKQSDPLPQPGEPATKTIRLYWPLSPSPDGARILVQIGYYGSEGTIGILNTADGSITNIEGNEVPGCCHATWSIDGQSLYMANPSPGLFGTGLWRIDAQTGQATRIIGAARDSATTQLAGHAHPATDGKLYFFYGEIEATAVTTAPTLQMRVAEGDAFATQTALRDDTFSVTEALWSHELTPSGAVIVDGSQAQQYPFAGPLRYLKTDGSPALTLTEKLVRLLRWGK